VYLSVFVPYWQEKIRHKGRKTQRIHKEFKKKTYKSGDLLLRKIGDFTFAIYNSKAAFSK